MENERNKRLISSVICIVLALALVFEFVYATFQNLEEQYVVRMEETGEQITGAIRQHIKASVSVASVLARGFESYEDIHSDAALEQLRHTKDETDFTAIWIAKPNGIAISTSGEVYNFSGRSYIINGLHKQSGISPVQVYGEDAVKNIVIYAPMYQDYTVKGLVLCMYSLSELRESMSIQCFGGQGKCEVMLPSGEIIVRSEGSQSSEGSNILSDLRHQKLLRNETVNNIEQRIMNNENGCIVYKEGDHYHYEYYMPVGVNDWYLMLSIPDGTVANDFRNFLTSTMLVVCALLGMAAVLFLFYYREKSNVMRKLIESDSLTGLLTRGAIEDKINEKLANTGELSFAMLVMDIDNFKKVNDRYGHMIGDKVLKKMSSLLHMEFSDEIIGRLGGDEFGVFISPHGRSEEEIKEQVVRFTDKLRKINSIDGDAVDISVSIGMAYSPSDGNTFNTLYKKADERMYSVKTSGKDGIA